jgi:hypothetical protein
MAFQHIGDQFPYGIFVIDNEHGSLLGSGAGLDAGGYEAGLIQEGFLRMEPKLT